MMRYRSGLRVGNRDLLGENLYSADGQSVRSLDQHYADGYVFAPDGKQLYGLRGTDSGEAFFTPGCRLGQRESGRCVGTGISTTQPAQSGSPFESFPRREEIAYAAAKFNDNLWMLEGFAQRVSWLKKAFGL